MDKLWFLIQFAIIAQLIEHSPSKPGVAGLSPAYRSIFINLKLTDMKKVIKFLLGVIALAAVCLFAYNYFVKSGETTELPAQVTTETVEVVETIDSLTTTNTTETNE